MNKSNKFPKLKKQLANFISDEEGSILRPKATVAGPLAVGAVLVMSKELATTAEASRYVSHASHRSHASGNSQQNHTSHSNTSHNNVADTSGAPSHSNVSHPSHSSHSSGVSSGF